MSAWKSLLIGVVFASPLANMPDASQAQALPPRQATEALFSISGQVVDVLDGAYILRSGGGRTHIRFTGWPDDFRGRGAVMDIGDNVMATGWLAEDTLSVGGALDVVGVYVENRRAYFTLGQAAAEDDGNGVELLPPSGDFGPVDDSASLTGIISEIEGDEITLRAGEAQIPVATSSLSYNPFDEIGSQGLAIGDTVTIDGILEQSADGGMRLQARRLTQIFVVGSTR